MMKRAWSVSFTFIVVTSLFPTLVNSIGKKQGPNNQELVFPLPLVHRLLQNVSTSSCADEYTALAQCWNKTNSTPTDFVACQDCLITASEAAVAGLVTDLEPICAGVAECCVFLQNAYCTMLKSCPCTSPCLAEFTAETDCYMFSLLMSCPTQNCSDDDSTTTPSTSSGFLQKFAAGLSMSLLVTMMIVGMVVNSI